MRIGLLLSCLAQAFCAVNAQQWFYPQQQTFFNANQQQQTVQFRPQFVQQQQQQGFYQPQQFFVPQQQQPQQQLWTPNNFQRPPFAQQQIPLSQQIVELPIETIPPGPPPTPAPHFGQQLSSAKHMHRGRVAHQDASDVVSSNALPRRDLPLPTQQKLSEATEFQVNRQPRIQQQQQQQAGTPRPLRPRKFRIRMRIPPPPPPPQQFLPSGPRASTRVTQPPQSVGRIRTRTTKRATTTTTATESTSVIVTLPPSPPPITEGPRRVIATERTPKPTASVLSKTVVGSANDVFLQCCKERKVDATCESRCNFDILSKKVLTGMFLGSDPCPQNYGRDLLSCAAQDSDHSECCRARGVASTSAGDKCLGFCQMLPGSEFQADISMLPCWGVLKDIKHCFKDAIIARG